MPDIDSISTRAPLHQRTVGGRLRAIARLDPDRAALVAGDQEYSATFADLLEQTGLAARGLMATGVERGDRVAIWASERYESTVLGLAAARTGAILVAIDPECDAAELGDGLAATGARLLAMSRGSRAVDRGELLEQARGRCPWLRSVVMLDGEWHAFLEEGAHVSACELAAREALVGLGDDVCAWPVALTHRELLAGGDNVAPAPGLGALNVILRGARVFLPNRGFA